MPRTTFFSTKLMFSLILCLLCYATPAAAQPDMHESTDATSVPTRLDVTHGKISQRLNNASQWFDNFFNDPRVDEEPAGTMIRLRFSPTIDKDEGVSFKTKIKANVELPNLKKRYHLILSNEDDDLKQAEDSLPSDRLRDHNNATTLALQYTKWLKNNIVYSNQLSVRWDDGINPRLRSRIRYTQPVTEKSLLNFTQSLFWEQQDGFGQENRIDYDYILGKDLLLRTTGNGLFSEVSNGYDWVAKQQLLVPISHKKAINFGAYVLGETRPQNHVTEYVVYTEYRQRFIKKWLFFELLPEVYWPRENDFKTAYAFTLTFEIRFGGRK